LVNLGLYLLGNGAYNTNRYHLQLLRQFATATICHSDNLPQRQFATFC